MHYMTGLLLFSLLTACACVRRRAAYGEHEPELDALADDGWINCRTRNKR